MTSSQCHFSIEMTPANILDFVDLFCFLYILIFIILSFLSSFEISAQNKLYRVSEGFSGEVNRMKTLVLLLSWTCLNNQRTIPSPWQEGFAKHSLPPQKMTLPRCLTLAAAQVKHTNSGCLYGRTAETTLRHNTSCCSLCENQLQDEADAINTFKRNQIHYVEK